MEKFAIEWEDMTTGQHFVLRVQGARVAKNKLFELLTNHLQVAKLWIWEEHEGWRRM